MIDSAGFADLRGYLKRRIACARFRVGSTYYTVPLSGIDILADGTVRARVSITGLGEITVNRVELLNSDNQVWAHEDVNIKSQQVRLVSCTGLTSRSPRKEGGVTVYQKLIGVTMLRTSPVCTSSPTIKTERGPLPLLAR